ncbi:MAG: type II toxin-antitoxin system VapC family toxin [Crenarchaeota archaeon]|nr:type II toxin-antitoxin system VapC family toxin [Thermoproteota archaeon]
MKQVLDSRFLIEYYYSDDEKIRKKTNDKIKELTQNPNGIIPTIVICETIQLICSKEGKQKAEMIFLSLTASKIKIESLTPSIAKEAGMLKSTYKHIPMGDCIIAATAIKNQAKIISDDPHFDTIKEIKRIWL